MAEDKRTSEFLLDGTTTAKRVRDRALLSAAFEIPIADVISDARRLLTSRAPRDELLVSICHTHRWDAEMGVIYLAHLRRHVDPSAGPLPSAWSCA